MQCGQLIHYNMRNIFLETSYTKCGGETSPRPFSEKLKFRISLDQNSNVLCSFYCIPSRRLLKYIETKLLMTCLYVILSFFKQQKGDWNLSPCIILCIIFEKKIFFLIYSINWLSSIAWMSLLREILGNMCTAIVCSPGFDVMNFEINLNILIKQFFQHDQKVITKT